MKKITLLVLFLLTGALCSAYTQKQPIDEMQFASPEEQAKHAHDLAASDMIYEHQDIKALYFQNQQIIELLQQIRDEMQSLNKRQAKEQQQA